MSRAARRPGVGGGCALSYRGLCNSPVTESSRRDYGLAPQLRARLGELPRDREIQVICRSAVRAYYATRILIQNGFKARNISGGMLARSHRTAD